MECLTTWQQRNKLFLIARLLGHNTAAANCFVRSLHLLLARLVGQCCFARWRLLSVVVCNAAVGQAGRPPGAWAVGRRRASPVGGRESDNARRASTVTAPLGRHLVYTRTYNKLCRSFLLPDRNVRWPRRMLFPGESRSVCRRDRPSSRCYYIRLLGQTDGRTSDCYMMQDGSFH